MNLNLNYKANINKWLVQLIKKSINIQILIEYKKTKYSKKKRNKIEKK